MLLLQASADCHCMLAGESRISSNMTILSAFYRTQKLQFKAPKLFLSELSRMSINFNNFWQIDEKMAKTIFYINIFHLTSLMSSQYLVKHKSAKFVHNA